MSKNIVLFDNKINCCGCAACSSICSVGAISMSHDKHGFFFPELDNKKCVKCGMCLKACPIKKRDNELSTQAQKPHIRIVNYGTSDNFGAVLTAVCLESKVRSIVPEDYIVQTINYDANGELWNNRTRFKQKLCAKTELMGVFLERLHLKKPSESKLTNPTHEGSFLRTHRYNKFRNKFLNFTVKSDNRDLDSIKCNDAALICGSDVIWFPSRVTMRSAKGFYLDFGSPNAKRIAFSASLDSAVNFELKKKRRAYRKHLKKFDAISVRETTDIDFIQSLTKTEVRKTVDPVFLYKPEDFDEMLSVSEVPITDEEYIYAYILMNNDQAYEYALKLAKEKNLKIYFFADFYKDFGDGAVDCYDDGPAEFMQRIKNAKYIVTTSFHCIVFSLLFKKQFLAFERGNNSIKIPDILETFGIPERLAGNDSTVDIDEPIDFNKTDRLIEKYRKDAIDFLRESVGTLKK